MEFETELQQSCYQKILPWMQELFSEKLIRYPDEPLFAVNFGSAVAYTEVIPWDSDEAIVITRAYVVTDVELTTDLLYYLLRENDSLYFGRFAIDDDGDVVFEHSIMGSTCDREELRTSVMAIAKFADDYDDEIVARWGGQRAADRLLSRALMS